MANQVPLRQRWWSAVSVRAALYWIAAAITLPQLVFDVVLLQRYAAAERARIEIELMAAAEGAARAIDSRFAAVEAQLQILAGSPLLQSVDLVAFDRLLHHLSAETGRSFELSDGAGRTVVNTPVAVDTSPPLHADPQFYETLFREGDRVVSDVLTGAADSEPTARIGVPVKRDGKVVWALSTILTTKDFADILSSPGVPPDWVLSIVDRTGRHLVRSHRNEVFAGQRLVPQLVEHMQHGGTGTLRTVSLEGTPLISTVARAPTSGWAAAVGFPVASLDAPLWRHLRDAVVMGLVLLSFALGLAWLVARQIERAMAQFVQQSQALARGEPVTAQHSLFRETRIAEAALAQAAGELQARDGRLRDLNNVLEDRVFARTMDLRETNEKLIAEAKRREETEAKVRQMQKVEAIGQLTGGIAHDFNNMLAVVLGSLRLLEQRLARGDPNPQEFIATAKQGAERAAALTRRLLAFARQQSLAPEVIDVNKLLDGMSDLLRRTITERIKIETVLADDLWSTCVDRHEFEATILNLVVNARDAMPDGGTLTIETANTELDEGYAARHEDVTAGRYVMVAVSDTGTGMSPEVSGRAFEPFFTTKGVGKGTGLGLSQVYGFVKQSGGHVSLYSEVGKGVSVKLYFPPTEGAASTVEPLTEPQGAMPMAQEQAPILVVEDDAEVLKVTMGMLTELGYRTIAADGAATALKLLDHHPDVALLLTDIVMPEMSGRQLAAAALQARPNLKVIYTTGYTRNSVVYGGVIDESAELIMKPFSLEALATKIDKVLR